MAPRFSLAQVETGKENLDALPPADKDTREVGLRDAIRMLAPTLRKLEAKGYSQPKIVDLLREQGITISLSTLKEYLRERSARKTKSSANSAAPPAPDIALTLTPEIAAPKAVPTTERPEAGARRVGAAGGRS